MRRFWIVIVCLLALGISCARPKPAPKPVAKSAAKVTKPAKPVVAAKPAPKPVVAAKPVIANTHDHADTP